MGQKDPSTTTKWTKEKGDKIIELLKEGRFKVHACAINHITLQTFYNWIEASQEGKHVNPDSPEGDVYWPGFEDFANRVLEAEAEYCRSVEEKLDNYAKSGKNPDWKGPAWLLERKFPKLYGEAASKVEISGSVNIGIPDIQKAIADAKKEQSENG
jgi:hypothetical protein